MTTIRAVSSSISALISDVDGTLVTDEKDLTVRTKKAVQAVHSAGIAFTIIISSRPPRGLRTLVDALAIATPIAGFNGGTLAAPNGSLIKQHLLAPSVARRAVEIINAAGAQSWVFAGEDWLLLDPCGPYIDFEQHTVRFQPTVVESFERGLDEAVKIVGVSQYFALLAELEGTARTSLAEEATVARSQHYYLDITHPLANKGDALSELARLLAVPLTEIAVISDGANDLAMFERSGLSIAMGNASPELQRSADFTTDSNADEGFANAVERFILGHLSSRAATRRGQEVPLDRTT
jgi:Cof subfamily protein (haloacid dehalogenase superfamily)